jgi:hypothetical protein
MLPDDDFFAAVHEPLYGAILGEGSPLGASEHSIPVPWPLLTPVSLVGLLCARTRDSGMPNARPIASPI